MRKTESKIRKTRTKTEHLSTVLALIVALMLIAVYVHYRRSPNEEAEKIADKILNDKLIGLAYGGVVKENKLHEIQNMEYEDFKSQLNVKNDFCIYIEDGNGNLILAKSSPVLNGKELFCR